MPHYILDEKGNPKRVEDTILWADWIQNNNVSIGTEMFSKFNTRVSTVFLGLDYSFDDSGPPLLYETMVFSDHMRWVTESYQVRKYSREEALAEHSRAVATVKKWLEGFKTTEEILGEIIEAWDD